MKRTMSAIALTIALVAGGSASAEACTYRIDPRELGQSATYRPTDPGVKACVSALKWAHAKPSADRDDFAVIVCGKTVTTPKQAKSLYKWVKQHKWAAALIG